MQQSYCHLRTNAVKGTANHPTKNRRYSDKQRLDSAVFNSTVTAGTRIKCLAEIPNGMPNGTENSRENDNLQRLTKNFKRKFREFPFHLIPYGDFRKFRSNGSRPTTAT